MLVLEHRGLAFVPLAATYVQIVQDADQPRTNPKRLQVEFRRRPKGAEVGLLHQIFGVVGIARHPPGDAIEQVQMLQGQGLKLFALEFHVVVATP